MSNNFEDVRIIGVDDDNIRECTNGSLECPFLLSAEPDYIWVSMFEEVCRLKIVSYKRDGFIKSDRLIVRMGPNDNTQRLLVYFKEVVSDTNIKYKRDYLRQIYLRQFYQSQQEQKRQQEIEKFKKGIDNLEF
jgi:hypothetical protein